MRTKVRATIEDFYHIPEHGKAEIVNIVRLMPAGGMPGRASGRIYRSLDDYERSHGGGYAFGAPL